MSNIYRSELAVDVNRGATVVHENDVTEVVGRRHSFADGTVSFVLDGRGGVRFPVTLPFDAEVLTIVG